MLFEVKVILYTTEPCGFCHSAKALLREREIPYEEVNLAADPVGRNALARLTGMLTFPQIVIDERPLGGMRELLAADEDGTLRALLVG